MAALALWNDLRERRRELDRPVFTAAAGAFVAAGQLQAARSLVDEMEALSLVPGIRMCVHLHPAPAARSHSPARP